MSNPTHLQLCLFFFFAKVGLVALVNDVDEHDEDYDAGCDAKDMVEILLSISQMQVNGANDPRLLIDHFKV